jgi:hypothetical protein
MAARARASGTARPAMTIDEAIERIGVGHFQWRLLIGARLAGVNLPLALAIYAAFFVIAGIVTLFVGQDTRNVRLADRTAEFAT